MKSPQLNPTQECPIIHEYRLWMIYSEYLARKLTQMMLRYWICFEKTFYQPQCQGSISMQSQIIRFAYSLFLHTVRYYDDKNFSFETIAFEVLFKISKARLIFLMRDLVGFIDNLPSYLWFFYLVCSLPSMKKHFDQGKCHPKYPRLSIDQVDNTYTATLPISGFCEIISVKNNF